MGPPKFLSASLQTCHALRTPTDPRESHQCDSSVSASSALKLSPSAFCSNGAVPDFRRCGPPYGLLGSLCTLRMIRSPAWLLCLQGEFGCLSSGLVPLCSDSVARRALFPQRQTASQCPLSTWVGALTCSGADSYTYATLDMGGWLGLTQQGLAPCKKRQASLGALMSMFITFRNLFMFCLFAFRFF